MSFVDGASLPTLHLGGLDRDAAAALVGEEAVDRLYAATAGNPLALLELAPEAARLADLPIDAPAADRGQRRAGIRAARRSAAGADAARTPGRRRERHRRAAVARAARIRGWPSSSSRPKQSASSRFATARFEFSHVLARSAVYGAAAPADRRCSPSGAGASAAGPRRRPPRLAPRARHRRPGRDRGFGARTGRRPRLRAQRLRRRGRRIRARGDTLGRGPTGCSTRPRTRRGSPVRPSGRSRSSSKRIRPTRTCRSRSRSSTCAARSRRAAGRCTEAREILAARRRARGRSAIRRPQRSCSPRRRTCRSIAGDAREMLRTAERAHELSRGLEGRAPILAGPRPGDGADPGGRGGGRRSLDPRCRRSAGGVGRAARRPAPRRLGRPWAAVAS